MKIKLLFLFLAISGLTNAQSITVKFATNDSCIGNPICFYDISTSKNGLIKSWQWNFGDGSTASTKNPCHKFPTNGSFNVKLVVTDFSGEKDSLTKSINVHNQTKLSFISNNTVQCIGNNSFDFFNTTKDTGKIFYQWDLGDNTFSNSNYVSGKTYLNAGSYNVKLISLNQYNCFDFLIKTIQVAALPKPDFNWGDVCNPSQFYYRGSLPISKFLWNFNNESISTLQNPSCVFKTLGIKNIKLTVTSNEGCKDSLIKDVQIKKQSWSYFSFFDVCEKDSAKFINKSKDADSLIWKFGDGFKSTDSNPKHLYNIGGVSMTFNVTLVAFLKDGCADSISMPITVNALPNSDFDWTQRSGRSIYLKANQSGNTYYRWIFDGIDSIIGNQNPIHEWSPGMLICLKVRNAASCISETCREFNFGSVSMSEPLTFKIYPNPATQTLTIETTNTKPFQIKVFNAVGQIVLTKQLNSSSETIEVNNLSQGVYILEIAADEIISRMRFLKE